MNKYNYGYGYSYGSNLFSPANLPNLVAWYRFNTGITVTGAGVSTWADQSGNSNDLLQTTDSHRPSEEADGSILFDGVDNHLEATFTFDAPMTIFILAKIITWTRNDLVFVGVAGAGAGLLEHFNSPEIKKTGGVASNANSDWTLDTYAAVTTVVNDTDSFTKVDNNASVGGGSGGSDMNGFVLGADDDGTNAANIEAKEAILYSGELSSVNIDLVITYLLSI